ncbi:MAG: hypothetical protein IJY08_02705 [Clostridia bacterium]|nr:hypothetical protein [Clostridia bacterium]
MSKIDKVVLRETKYIAAWVIIFSAIMQAVFLVIGKWDYTVLLGNLLSGAAVILNFLGMGMTVQKAVDKEEKEAKQAMKASGMVRTFLLFITVVIGVLLDCFSIWTVIIPLFFPRIAVAIRPLWDKKANKKANKKEADESEG